jgi:hypothetical protein
VVVLRMSLQVSLRSAVRRGHLQAMFGLLPSVAGEAVGKKQAVAAIQSG